jgi:phosphoglycerate-specific signal transduction histidine kinase
VLIIIVPSIAGILGGVAAIMAARRAHAVKTHLTQKEMEEREWREKNIGVANGHGTLMRQMTMTMEHVGNLNEHVMDLKDGQAKIIGKMAQVEGELAHHINGSTSYRESVRLEIGSLHQDIGSLHQDIGSLHQDLKDHVAWEVTQFPFPWDGTERRKSPPPNDPPAGKQERRRR